MKHHDPNQEMIIQQVRKQLDYLLTEGVVVIDRYSEEGEPIYRLKTEEEIQAELDSIVNS